MYTCKSDSCVYFLDTLFSSRAAGWGFMSEISIEHPVLQQSLGPPPEDITLDTRQSFPGGKVEEPLSENAPFLSFFSMHLSEGLHQVGWCWDFRTATWQDTKPRKHLFGVELYNTEMCDSGAWRAQCSYCTRCLPKDQRQVLALRLNILDLRGMVFAPKQ